MELSCDVLLDRNPALLVLYLQRTDVGTGSERRSVLPNNIQLPDPDAVCLQLIGDLADDPVTLF